jgi:MoaA/NifB/PqqE/SkfB family radical SAM enzyme
MEFLTSKQEISLPLAPGKFTDPDRTAKGEPRAAVPLARLETLWINTGTLCNIACVNCYIESNPRNDRLEYVTAAEAAVFLDEIEALGLKTREIGFTGGEPFLNPDMLAMAGAALKRGLEVLILTNAMTPMQRPRTKAGLMDLKVRYGARLRLRVSLDHYTGKLHETERGPGSWASTLGGLDWLTEHGFRIAVAGRTCWGEPEDRLRAGYARLFAERGIVVDAHDSSELVLFPEMNERLDVAEITSACWGILGVEPSSVMCATSRMVVKRNGAARPAVLPCTLIAYDEAFEMGASLAEAGKADGGNFTNGAVKLNHPHCARFCVLGGGSCAA